MEETLGPGAAREFRQQLLAPTLQNALRTPFYRERWHGVRVEAVGLDELCRLPPITKEELRAAGRAAQVREGLVCDEVFTSGTTGRPLVTVRGHQEQAFIQRFYGEVSRQEGSGQRLLRGLQINNPYHGFQVPVPARAHFHRIGIYDQGSFEHGRQVLLSPHQDEGVEERCTVLVGLERALRAFAEDVRAHHPGGLESPLRFILSYSQYLTARWRRTLEETFGARVIDKYSLSEVFGSATQSLECGWWHFEPTVVPEVISPRTGEPLHEGKGLLLVTALYPFQEAQPMVRYHTGDLVEVTHTRSSRPGELAFRPLGRARFGVREPGTEEWLLTPADILEIVDELQEVRRIPRFLDSAQVRDPYRIGHPRYAMRHREEEGRVRVEILLDVAPELAAERGPRLRRQVEAGLRQRSPRLDILCREGRAALEVRFEADLDVNLISHSQ